MHWLGKFVFLKAKNRENALRSRSIFAVQQAASTKVLWYVGWDPFQALSISKQERHGTHKHHYMTWNFESGQLDKIRRKTSEQWPPNSRRTPMQFNKVCISIQNLPHRRLADLMFKIDNNDITKHSLSSMSPYFSIILRIFTAQKKMIMLKRKNVTNIYFPHT